MCFLRDSKMKNGRKRSRIPIFIGRKDRFKAKRRKTDMMTETSREDEVYFTEDNQISVKEDKLNKLPSDLYDNSLMLQAFGGFLLFISKSGKILFVSKQVEDLIGFSPADMISHPITEFIHIKDFTQLNRQFKVTACQQSHKENQDIGAGNILRCTHHRMFYMRMKSISLKPGSKIKHNGLLMTKWTGRLKLRPSKKPKGYSTDGLLCFCQMSPSISSILEIRVAGNMFMSRHELDMKFIYCEQRIMALIGYEPTDVIGKTAYQFHNPLDAVKVSNCHYDLIVKGASMSKYYRFLGKGGDWIWMQTSASIVTNSKKEAQYIVCMNYIISPEEGEKFLKTEQEQNGFLDPHVHGCIDLTSPGSDSHLQPRSDIVNVTRVTKPRYSQTMEMTTDFLEMDFEDSVADNCVSNMTLIKNSDPLLCSTSVASTILPSNQQNFLDASKNVDGAANSNMDILDDLLENIQHYPSVSQSKTTPASSGSCQLSSLPSPLNQQSPSSQNLKSKQTLFNYFSQGLQETLDLPMEVDQLDSTSQASKSDPMFSSTRSEVQSPAESCQPSPTSTESCQGSLLRSLLHRDKSPPKISISSIPSTSSMISQPTSAQIKSTSFYTTSPSPSTSTSHKTLLSAVLTGNATLNIPIFKKAMSPPEKSIADQPPLSNRKFTCSSSPSRVSKFPKEMPSTPVSGCYSNGHSCSPTSVLIRATSNSCCKNSIATLNECSTNGHSCPASSAPKVQKSSITTSTAGANLSSYITSLESEKNCAKNALLNRNSYDHVNASDAYFSSDYANVLPDDLLDLAIQDCDKLGDDQTQALLAEFGQDLWKNAEELYEATTDNPLYSHAETSLNSPEYNVISAAEPSRHSMNPIQDSQSFQICQKSKMVPECSCEKVSSGQNNKQSYKIEQTYLNSSNINGQRTLPTGLQSPTVSSTEILKNVCNSPETKPSSQDLECDGYSLSDNLTESKNMISCQSIGVQTAYTNTKQSQNHHLFKDNGYHSKNANKMSELEQHLRGIKSFNFQTSQKVASKSPCQECDNIARYSKTTPFLHKLLTGEISRDIYYQIDKLIMEKENQKITAQKSSKYV